MLLNFYDFFKKQGLIIIIVRRGMRHDFQFMTARIDDKVKPYHPRQFFMKKK